VRWCVAGLLLKYLADQAQQREVDLAAAEEAGGVEGGGAHGEEDGGEEEEVREEMGRRRLDVEAGHEKLRQQGEREEEEESAGVGDAIFLEGRFAEGASSKLDKSEVLRGELVTEDRFRKANKAGGAGAGTSRSRGGVDLSDL
jgi:hypothetical protein